MPVLAMAVTTAAKHPNADALRVYTLCAPGRSPVQVIANLENVYEPGDTVAVALVGTTLADGTEIKKAKLRGALSFGMALGRTDAPAGAELSERFGAKEAGPGADASQGVVEESEWPRYTSLASYLKYRDEILGAASVVVSEKLHGSNFRFGFHHQREFLVGTHTSRVVDERLDPDTWPAGHLVGRMLRWVDACDARGRLQRYRARHPDVRSLAVYGELHGFKCSDLHYGMAGDGVRLFGEVNRDGAWLGYEAALEVIRELFPDVELEDLLVPVLYVGKPDAELFRRLRDEPSRLAARHGAQQLGEGVVIRSADERFSAAIGDRLVLKYKSPLYEERRSLRNADPEAIPRYVTAYDLLQDFVTEERLRHVLAKAQASGVEAGARNRHKLTERLLDDIVKESAGEWPEGAELDRRILLEMTKKLSAELFDALLRELPAP